MSQTRTQNITEITFAIPRILSQAPTRTAIPSERQERLHEAVQPAATGRVRRRNAHWPNAALGDPRQIQAACWHRNSCQTCPGRASCQTRGR